MITSAEIDRLHSATVRTPNGTVVGHVSDVYVDDDGVPLLLAVRSGLLSLREVLVPAAGAVLVGREVLIAVSDAAIASAPTAGTTPGGDDLGLDGVLAYWATRVLHGLGEPAAALAPAA